MGVISWTRVRRALCCVLIVAAGAALADDRPSSLRPGEKVDVTFRLLFTPSAGGTREIATWGPFALEVGQGMTALGLPPFAFAAGATSQACNTTVGTYSVEDLFRQDAYTTAWTADAKVLEAATDRLVLSASWKRSQRSDRGNPVDAAAETIPRLTLREGERVLLDYFGRGDGLESSCARNYALEMEASIHDEALSAQKQIAYDVWLVDETPAGTRTTSRAQLTARHGEKLPFAFPTRRLHSTATGIDGGQLLEVAVEGELRGRVRRDGTLELSVRTNRSLSYKAADGSSDGGITNGGEKALQLQPGETIRIEIPSPDESPTRNDPRVPQMAKDLAGHTFAIILTANAL